jgi:hypothetical protein
MRVSQRLGGGPSSQFFVEFVGNLINADRVVLPVLLNREVQERPVIKVVQRTLRLATAKLLLIHCAVSGRPRNLVLISGVDVNTSSTNDRSAWLIYKRPQCSSIPLAGSHLEWN